MNIPPLRLTSHLSLDPYFNFNTTTSFTTTPKPLFLGSKKPSPTTKSITSRHSKPEDPLLQTFRINKPIYTHRRTTSLQSQDQVKKSFQQKNSPRQNEVVIRKKRPPKLTMSELPSSITNIKLLNVETTKSTRVETKNGKLDIKNGPSYEKPTLSSLLSKKEKTSNDITLKNFNLSKPAQVYQEYYSPGSASKSDRSSKGSQSHREKGKENKTESLKKRLSEDNISPYLTHSKPKSSKTKRIDSTNTGQTERRHSLKKEELTENKISSEQPQEEEKKSNNKKLNIPKIKINELQSIAHEKGLNQKKIQDEYGVISKMREINNDLRVVNNKEKLRDDTSKSWLQAGPFFKDVQNKEESVQQNTTTRGMSLSNREENSRITIEDNTEHEKKKKVTIENVEIKPFFTPRDNKNNILSSTNGSFFTINKENKWISELERIYVNAFPFSRTNSQSHKSSDINTETDDKTTQHDGKPIVVILDERNKIIQPAYMKKIGSMCFTELWPEKINKKFLSIVKDSSTQKKIGHIRAVSRQNETIFKPKRWQNEEKLNKRLTEMNCAWGDTVEIKAMAMKTQQELYREARAKLPRKSMDVSAQRGFDSHRDFIRKGSNIEEKVQVLISHRKARMSEVFEKRQKLEKEMG